MGFISALPQGDVGCNCSPARWLGILWGDMESLLSLLAPRTEQVLGMCGWYPINTHLHPGL